MSRRQVFTLFPWNDFKFRTNLKREAEGGDVRSQFISAHHYLLIGNRKEAMTYFAMICENGNASDKDIGKASYQIAQIFSSNNEPDKSLISLKVAANHGHEKAILEYGRCLKGQQQYGAAAKQFSKIALSSEGAGALELDSMYQAMAKRVKAFVGNDAIESVLTTRLYEADNVFFIRQANTTSSFDVSNFFRQFKEVSKIHSNLNKLQAKIKAANVLTAPEDIPRLPHLSKDS